MKVKEPDMAETQEHLKKRDMKINQKAADFTQQKCTNPIILNQDSKKRDYISQNFADMIIEAGD